MCVRGTSATCGAGNTVKKAGGIGGGWIVAKLGEEREEYGMERLREGWILPPPWAAFLSPFPLWIYASKIGARLWSGSSYEGVR